MTQIEKDLLVFTSDTIEWSYISDIFCEHLGTAEGIKKYNEFLKWMSGKTSTLHAVFKWDLEDFLSKHL